MSDRLTRSFGSELWTSSGSGKSLSRGRLRNRQCLGPLSHIGVPLGDLLLGFTYASFVAVSPIRSLDRKCTLCTEPRSMNVEEFAAILHSVDMQRAEVL